jgi:phospholipase C
MGVRLLNDSAAINYAILMVNDQENKDYYDNFVPMVIESINRSPNEIISINEVQKDMINHFGLDIPLNVRLNDPQLKALFILLDSSSVTLNMIV